MEKDNRTHRLLGALLKRMAKNDYQPTYISLATSIHPWYKYLYYRFFKRTQNEVRGLFDRIGPNGDRVFMGMVQDFHPTTLSHEDLWRIQNHYALGTYKKDISWGALLARAVAIIAPIVIGTTAILNTIDNRKAPILTDSLRIEKHRIELLLQRLGKDSALISSMRDSLRFI